jgi:prepilin-type N-terminal cleavage/methylation domain-containing protein
MNSTDRTRGFTLIELLVVIGLIAVLAGGIGAALLRGSPSKALQNAQGSLSSLVTVARSRAALAQTDAAIFVNIEPGKDGFLRELRVAVLAGPGQWAAVGAPVILDRGIYLVPPATGVAAADADFEPSTAAWDDLRSNAFGVTDITLRRPDNLANLSSDDYRMVELFNSRGGVEPFTTVGGARTDRRIVLSPARVDADKIVFDNPSAIRGFLVSRYGVGIFVNDDQSLLPP